MAVLAAAVLLVLAGCGGDDDDAADSSVSSAAYIADVNARCEEMNAEIQSTVLPLSEKLQKQGKSQDEIIAAGIQAGIPITEEALDEIAAYPRPEADAEELEAFFTRIDESFPLYDRLVPIVRKGDQQAAADLNEEFVAIAEDTRPFAEEYGITACVAGSSGV
jgi:hypothetical protein